MNPNIRALAATLLFSAAGLWSVFFRAAPWNFLLPHLLFYMVLVFNTYFSVRFYSGITPDTTFQFLIDGALVVSNLALALTIGLPLPFAVCAVVLFTIAPAKYAHMLGQTPHVKTLRKKILIDLLGAIMSSSVMILTLFGYDSEAAWTLAILFGLANVYLLAINPMYRLID